MSRDESDTSSSSDMDELMDVIMVTEINNYMSRSIGKQPCRTSALTGYEYIRELLDGHPTRIYEMLRMDAPTFMSLCNTLRNGYLEENQHRHVPIEESLAIFLLTVGHSTRHRVVAERFQHSTETINRHIKHVMRALATLGTVIIRPKIPYETPPEILNNPKFNPYFLGCIGAIDGTHIAAWAPAVKQTAFRGRKVSVTQNVLAACSFDLLFTFVYPGWEGSANDSRVFLNAITQPDVQFPMPPLGKYYVVDAGFTNMPGFLSPYRGERYHMRDFQGRGRGPRGPRELFNHRHSSLRNAIERCFGILKARFPLLKHMTNYKVVRQGPLVIACCAIHNFVRMHSNADMLFQEEMVQDINEDGDGNHAIQPDVNMSQPQLNQMAALRDDLAGHMWQDYENNGE